MRFASLGVGFCFLVVFGFAKSAGTHTNEDGVLVYFAPVAKTVAVRLRFHKWMQSKQFKLGYQLKSSPIEFWRGQSSSSLEMCDVIRQKFSLLVASCSINEKLVPQEAPAKKDAHAAEAAPEVEKTCNLLEAFDGKAEVVKGLSVLWAQEYVGMDLAYWRWQKWAEEEPQLKAPRLTRVNAMDTGEHANYVTALMQLNIPSTAAKSVGPMGFDRIKFFPMHEGSDSYNSHYLQALDKMKEGMDVVNISMGNISDVTFKAMGDYAKAHKTLFVISAGNEYPSFEIEKNNFRDAIVVGSLSSNGNLADFSSEFPNVAIVAPSDKFLVSFEHQNAFSGTSGAAPLVSSAMTMVKNILPQLESADAKKLLTATALPTWNKFEAEPKVNGAGTLNAAKLVSAAIQVRKACGADPAKDRDCFERELKNIASPILELNTNLQRQIASTFGCNVNASEKVARIEKSCAEKKLLFHKLRKEAYEHPDAAPYWQLLACIHEQMNYSMNAKFYTALTAAGWPQTSEIEGRKAIQKLNGEGAGRNSLFGMDPGDRWRYLLSKDYGSVLERGSDEVRGSVIGALSYLPEDKARGLLDRLVRSAVSWRAVQQYLKNPITPELLATLNRYLEDADPKVRRTFAGGLDSLPAEQAVPLIEKSLGDSDRGVRIRAAQHLEKMPDVKFELLEKVASDAEVEVQFCALKAVRERSAQERIVMMDKFINSSDPRIQNELLIVAASLDAGAVSPYLEKLKPFVHKKDQYDSAKIVEAKQKLATQLRLRNNTRESPWEKVPKDQRPD